MDLLFGGSSDRLVLKTLKYRASLLAGRLQVHERMIPGIGTCW
jgi:hypothetical protein